MGTPFKPLPVKLIIGTIASDPKLMDLAQKRLINKFGPIETRSPVWDFSQTSYYEKEMGPDLKRQFLIFKKCIHASALVNIKHSTNALELSLSRPAKKRRINLDPGYLTLSKLVLATTKNFAHRIYIKDGISEEITLTFHNNSFQANPWTYPDYKTEQYISFFNETRNKYRVTLEANYGLSRLPECL